MTSFGCTVYFLQVFNISKIREQFLIGHPYFSTTPCRYIGKIGGIELASISICINIGSIAGQKKDMSIKDMYKEHRYYFRFDVSFLDMSFLDELFKCNLQVFFEKYIITKFI